jgi:hypothetical protein
MHYHIFLYKRYIILFIYSFYTIGGLQILSSVIIFIERLLWKLKQKTDPVGIGQMEHTKTTENNLLEENIPKKKQF